VPRSGPSEVGGQIGAQLAGADVLRHVYFTVHTGACDVRAEHGTVRA
jgi:hypothetical protein